MAAAAVIDDEVRALFEAANFGHLATLMSDGSPHSVAVRYTGAPFPMRSGVVYLIEPERAGLTELPFADRPGGDSR